jgi:hypothetical protein
MSKEPFSKEKNIKNQVDFDENQDNNSEAEEKLLSKTGPYSFLTTKSESVEINCKKKSKTISLFDSYEQPCIENSTKDSKTSNFVKAATLNMKQSQSALTKCNSAPPPIPSCLNNNKPFKFSIETQPTTKQIDPQNNTSKSTMIQQSLSCSFSTPVSSSRRLVASMSARSYGNQSDNLSNLHNSLHQNHHNQNNSATAMAAAALALNHATMTANLNKFDSNYSIQKDISSSYTQPFYPYSQFYQSQQQNNHPSLQKSQKNSSSISIDLYQQSSGLTLYPNGSHSTNNHDCNSNC